MIDEVNILSCKCCQEEIDANSEYCPECGYPLNGSEEEQSKHIGRYILGIHTTTEEERQVTKSRNGLFIVSGLLVVTGVWSAFGGSEEGAVNLVGSFILAIIFTGLAFWSDKNPFAAFLLALTIFLSLQIIAVMVDPYSLLSGIIVKVLVLVLLINGVYSAAKLRAK